MEELSYSFHIGSDKNKKNSVRLTSKNNVSGTNSMSNNAIQNAKQLSTADKHNYRKYDNRQDEILVLPLPGFPDIIVTFESIIFL